MDIEQGNFRKAPGIHLAGYTDDKSGWKPKGTRLAQSEAGGPSVESDLPLPRQAGHGGAAGYCRHVRVWVAPDHVRMTARGPRGAR